MHRVPRRALRRLTAAATIALLAGGAALLGPAALANATPATPATPAAPAAPAAQAGDATADALHIASPPTLSPASVTTHVAASTPVTFTLSGLDDVPSDQRFNVQYQRSGDAGWSNLEQVTAGDLAAHDGLVSFPRSVLPTAGAYFVQVTNWGMSPDYYDTAFTAGASISVIDAAGPSFVATDVFADRASGAPVTVQLAGYESLPDDQAFAVHTRAVGGSAWTPVTSTSVGALRGSWGQISIPLTAFPADGAFEIEVGTAGVSPNYLPDGFTITANATVGDFAPPTLADESLVTYTNSTHDVAFTLEGLADLPSDQRLNVQIGADGSTSGWQPVRDISLGELRSTGGKIAIPRGFLSEPGTYWVEVTNWGMTPNHYPSIFQVVGGIRVAELPTVSFAAPDGASETARTTVAGTENTFEVAVSGAITDGAELTLSVSDADGERFRSAPVPVAEDAAPTAVSVPGSVFTALFGDADTQLQVTADLALEEQVPDVQVPLRLSRAADAAPSNVVRYTVSGSLPVTVRAATPEIGLNAASYTVEQDRALPFSVTGLVGLPADLPVYLQLDSAAGAVAWKQQSTVGAIRSGAAFEIPEETLAQVGERSYTLSASVVAFDGEAVRAESPVTVTTVTPPGSQPGTSAPGAAAGGHLPTTGGATPLGLVAGALALLGAGAALTRTARTRRES